MDFLTEEEFIAEFKARLRKARTAMKWSQPQMASVLGLKLDAYKKLEKRAGSAFPMYLLPKLVFFTQRPYAYWLGPQPTASGRFRVVE